MNEGNRNLILWMIPTTLTIILLIWSYIEINLDLWIVIFIPIMMTSWLWMPTLLEKTGIKRSNKK